MNNPAKVLQIVPRSPGSPDGVGDYALTLARKLFAGYGYKTTFAAHETTSAIIADGFEIVPLASLAPNGLLPRENDHVILHFVNYGYQKRGVPFWLLPILRNIRSQCPGNWLTVFHELYASGPPWKSAFWLHPLQIQIAKSISRLSDVCIVSSEVLLAQLRNLAPTTRAHVYPVPSNFGEPALSPDQITDRDLHRWVICGGTALIERSLRSFRTIASRIPESFFPRELFILGGHDNPATRSLLVELPGVRSEYYPHIDLAKASQILSSCSFAWLDYFHRADVPTNAVLKSSAFAAACAHGVIPIFPNGGSAISVEDDRLPGPFFVDSSSCDLPTIEDQAKVAAAFYNWYQHHASSDHLVRGISSALGLVAIEHGSVAAALCNEPTR